MQVAILLHAAGPEALKEYNTFDFAILPDHDPPTATLQEVLKKFREYCQPRKTRFMRDTASGQETNRREKIIHQWVMQLRNRAQTCAFRDQHDHNLRDKIVFSIRVQWTKERLLREASLTPQIALDT